jgi:hypothetical protein
MKLPNYEEFLSSLLDLTSSSWRLAKLQSALAGLGYKASTTYLRELCKRAAEEGFMKKDAVRVGNGDFWKVAPDGRMKIRQLLGVPLIVAEAV